MRSISQESVLALINIVIIYLDGGIEIVLCIFISDSNWVGDGSDLKDRAGIRTLNKLWETNCLKKNRWKVPHSFLPFSCLSTEWEIIDYSRALQDLESSQAKCQPKTSCVSKKHPNMLECVNRRVICKTYRAILMLYFRLRKPQLKHWVNTGTDLHSSWKESVWNMHPNQDIPKE